MIQSAHNAATPDTAPRSLLARASALVRRIIGVPDYELYRRHMAATHPGEPVLSEREFAEDCLKNKYSRPGQRCC